jgi:hypothetical protein
LTNEKYREALAKADFGLPGNFPAQTAFLVGAFFISKLKNYFTGFPDG